MPRTSYSGSKMCVPYMFYSLSAVSASFRCCTSAASLHGFLSDPLLGFGQAYYRLISENDGFRSVLIFTNVAWCSIRAGPVRYSACRVRFCPLCLLSRNECRCQGTAAFILVTGWAVLQYGCPAFLSCWVPAGITHGFRFFCSG